MDTKSEHSGSHSPSQPRRRASRLPGHNNQVQPTHGKPSRTTDKSMPLPPNAHIFAYKTKHRKTLTPLTKRKVVKRIKNITIANDLPNFEGHGLRIGGTLE